jgi:hypothetical protein
MLDTQSKLTPLEIEKRNRLKLCKPLVYKKVINFEEKLCKGESIAIIQLQYNYICNFHCSHCSISVFRHKKGARSLTIGERLYDIPVIAPSDILNHCMNPLVIITTINHIQVMNQLSRLGIELIYYLPIDVYINTETTRLP